MEVSRLVPAAWNYKTDDVIQAEKLKENIRRNGQIENILVRHLDGDRLEVVNGNHRLKVFEELGTKSVVVFDLGNIDENAAKRIAIETNETKFETDFVKLAELIKNISAGGTDYTDLASTMPFTISELDAMVKNLEFDWANFEKPVTAEQEEEPTKSRCPKCGFEFVE